MQKNFKHTQKNIKYKKNYWTNNNYYCPYKKKQKN